MDHDFKNQDCQNLNFEALAKALYYLDDVALIQNLNKVLSDLFGSIRIDNWISLVKKYHLDTFKEIFLSVGNSNNLYKIGTLIGLLKKLAQEQIKLDSSLLRQIDHIPNYINTNDIHNIGDSYLYYRDHSLKKAEVATLLILDILTLSTFKNKDGDWIRSTSGQITKSLSRKYLNKVVVPALLESDHKSLLFNSLLDSCIKKLSDKTKEKPKPLKTGPERFLTPNIMPRYGKC